MESQEANFIEIKAYIYLELCVLKNKCSTSFLNNYIHIDWLIKKTTTTNKTWENRCTQISLEWVSGLRLCRLAALFACVSGWPLRRPLQVRIEEVDEQWCGSLHVGLTTLAPPELPSCQLSGLSPSLPQLRTKVTWLLCGSEVRRNGALQRQNYCSSLDRLTVSYQCISQSNSLHWLFCWKFN